MKKLSATEQKNIIEEAKKSIDKWFSVWATNNAKYRDRTAFTLGDQWTSEEIELFRQYNKRELKFNKLYAIVKKILGEQLQHTPDIQVISITGDSKPESIQLRQDLLNTISYHSDAKVAYQTAFKCAMMGGYGAIKIENDYVSRNGFDQGIFIRKVVEPTMYFWDPRAQNPSKDDGQFAGEYFKMPRTEFDKKHPNTKVTSEILPMSGLSWIDDDFVTGIIYQRKEWYNKKILYLKNGKTMDEEEYNEEVGRYKMALKELIQNPNVVDEEIELPFELQVDKERKATDYKIRTYKIVGEQVIEHSDWISQYFGYIFVDNDSFWVDGKQNTRAFIEDVIDTQRFLNYLATQAAYLIKTMRNEQYMASALHVEGREQQWRNPELVQGALIYNPTPQNDKPTRMDPVMINPSLLQHYERALRDVETGLGLFEAYRGDVGQEISGRAIQQRIKQGNTTTYIPVDSLNRAITQCGKVVLDAMPNVYDTNRMMNLFTKDGQTKRVELNGINEMNEPTNILDEGEYTITVTPGAAFEQQRAEMFDAITDMLKTGGPQYFPIIADKLAENLSLPSAREIANRFRAIVPKDIMAAGKGEEPPPQQPQQPDPGMMLQMKQIEIKEKELELKTQQLLMDTERLRAEMAKIMVNANIQQLKASTEMDKAMMENEHTKMAHTLKMNDQVLKSVEHAHKVTNNLPQF